MCSRGHSAQRGQQNPLAYALYRNRFLADTGIETSSDAEQTGKQLLEKTEALAEAGALSQQAAKQARVRFWQSREHRPAVR